MNLVYKLLLFNLSLSIEILTMDLNENDEIGLPGTSGTSRFAFDFLDTESEEDVFSIWNNWF